MYVGIDSGRGYSRKQEERLRFGIVQKGLVSLLKSRGAGIPIGIKPRQLR